MRMSLARFLLPDPPRRLPYARAWNVGARTVHLAAVGVLLGGHVFGVGTERLLPWLWLAMASGAVLIAVELYSTLDWLTQGAGLFLVAKLAVLLAVPALWTWRVPLLFLVVALAGVGSHMPGRYRHYSFRHHRNMKTR
jgi:hypothetical protein